MFKLNKENKSVKKLTKVSYKELELKERNDIQEWVAHHPELLNNGNLLIIAKEYILPSISNIRLDLLAIDKDANLVIIELKRDNSGKDTYLQAIKYAAYCSAFKNNDIYEIYANYLNSNYKNINENNETAKQRILNFIGDDEDNLNSKQRLILVSKDFESDVVASVLWLREHDIDISCIKLEPLLDKESNEIFLDSNTIIPLPEAEDYIKRKESKEQEKNTIRSMFSLEKSNLNTDELRLRIQEDFNRESEQTYRLISFFDILLHKEYPVSREEIKEILFNQYNIGDNIGQTGRYLSNISQYLTKPNNGYLRQVIDFESGGDAGGEKNNYILVDTYRDLIREILKQYQES